MKPTTAEKARIPKSTCVEDRYPHIKKLPSAIKCSSEHKDEGGTRSPVLLLYPRTNLTYELLQLNYSRNRETSLKNALPDPKSQQHKQLIDCRKWETDTGNGVHKKQQMKPSSSKHIKKDIHTWLMFTTSLGFKSW
jgi:hypothetical protein